MTARLPSGHIDEERMVLVLDLDDEDQPQAVLRLRYEVCPTCDGRGKHVNPSVDGHGITQEEFAEDPEFAEAYFAGRYDVTCVTCAGKRVVLVVDEPEGTPQRRWYEDWRARRDAYERERALERKYGY